MAQAVIRLALTTAMLGIIGLSSWPSCQAQGLKGPGSNAAKVTPQQVRDVLRTKLLGQGKISPKISNPRAANNLGNSSIIAVLRSQKQAADSEQQAIMAMHAQDPGSINKSASANAAISGNKAISGNGAPQTEMRKVGGVSTAPQQPMGTRSASGGQLPLAGASTAAAIPPPSGSNSGATIAAMCTPTISTVNGQATGALFTPLPEWNPYTIKGCGFGNKAGNIYLSGPFAGGRVKLQVSVPQNRDRSNWSDGLIVANVDPQVRGEIDRDNVTLVIEPAGAAPIQKPGFKFYAARETVLLRWLPESAIRFAESSPRGMIAAVNPYPGRADREYRTPSQWVSPDMSAEVVRTAVNTPFEPGSDYFDFSTMTAGFTTENMQLQSEDPVNCIGNDFGGNWNARWEGDNIRVTWKEWICRLGYGTETPGGEAWEMISSVYALSVWVNGPRGVDPWAGASPPSGWRGLALH